MKVFPGTYLGLRQIHFHVLGQMVPIILPTKKIATNNNINNKNGNFICCSAVHSDSAAALSFTLWDTSLCSLPSWLGLWLSANCGEQACSKEVCRGGWWAKSQRTIAGTHHVPPLEPIASETVHLSFRAIQCNDLSQSICIFLLAFRFLWRQVHLIFTENHTHI